LIKLLPCILFEKKYIFRLHFSIGSGQPGEPALCQLYRHTFVPYGHRCRNVFGIDTRRPQAQGPVSTAGSAFLRVTSVASPLRVGPICFVERKSAYLQYGQRARARENAIDHRLSVSVHRSINSFNIVNCPHVRCMRRFHRRTTGVRLPAVPLSRNNLGQVAHTHVCFCHQAV